METPDSITLLKLLHEYKVHFPSLSDDIIRGTVQRFGHHHHRCSEFLEEVASRKKNLKYMFPNRRFAHRRKCFKSYQSDPFNHILDSSFFMSKGISRNSGFETPYRKIFTQRKKFYQNLTKESSVNSSLTRIPIWRRQSRRKKNVEFRGFTLQAHIEPFSPFALSQREFGFLHVSNSGSATVLRAEEEYEVPSENEKESRLTVVLQNNGSVLVSRKDKIGNSVVFSLQTDDDDEDYEYIQRESNLNILDSIKFSSPFVFRSSPNSRQNECLKIYPADEEKRNAFTRALLSQQIETKRLLERELSQEKEILKEILVEVEVLKALFLHDPIRLHQKSYSKRSQTRRAILSIQNDILLLHHSLSFLASRLSSASKRSNFQGIDESLEKDFEFFSSNGQKWNCFECTFKNESEFRSCQKCSSGGGMGL